ncbi:MAG: UDP-glucose/GDP-mannose dehydrogenase family protein [Rhizobiaceae bacterium]
MRIAVVGAGYVGLVSGACFADFGHAVTCVDRDPSRIERLSRNEMPIYEPGLGEIVANNRRAGRLAFTTDLAPAVRDADVVFIAVGTPSRRGDGHADLTYVHQAAREVAAALDGYTVVAIKSTVPVGTGDAVEKIIRETRPGADFCVVSNPEFLREGAAIADFKRPDRIVIGLEDERARPVMTDVYRPLYLNQAPLLFVSRRTSELIKYAANSFLAMKIAFINEVADLSESVGANVQDVARGIGLDNRIGSKFLNAGPGFGGSCFPKDLNALAVTARQAGSPIRLVETTIALNDARKLAMTDRIVAACGGSAAGKTVALLGLTFKPNTDDIREAPAIAIAGGLLAAGATVRAYDPQGMDAARAELADVHYASDPYDAAAGAHVLVIVTEWDEFRALDLEKVGAAMAARSIVDMRNIYRAPEVTRLGFAYSSIGRPTTAGAA